LPRRTAAKDEKLKSLETLRDDTPILAAADTRLNDIDLPLVNAGERSHGVWISPFDGDSESSGAPIATPRFSRGCRGAEALRCYFGSYLSFHSGVLMLLKRVRRKE
jgi:hypothetical protein